MLSFEQILADRLQMIASRGLQRHLRRVDSPQSKIITVEGVRLLNFSSNDYLGLANHPEVKAAALAVVKDFGAGAGASRLISGSLAPFHELEAALAAFKRTEAALTFSSGYAAAVGTISALLGRGDIIILDKLVHASIVGAARLSGATLRVFAHNDAQDLEKKLQWAAAARGKAAASGQKPAVLVAIESVYSMDGDQAPLREIIALKNRYNVWVLVDEAHATGILGGGQRGLAEAVGVSPEIEIHMGTMGKALGASGGFIAGSRTLIDFLVNSARSFIFSTAPVPAAAAAAMAALSLIRSGQCQERVNSLWENLRLASQHLRASAPQPESAILPVPIGDESRAMAVSGKLRERGLFVPAVRYPTVGRGKARLRVTLTAAHDRSDVLELLGHLDDLGIIGEKSHAPARKP